MVIARGVSNYDRPRVGISAAESLAETRVATDSAYLPALGECVAGGEPVDCEEFVTE